MVEVVTGEYNVNLPQGVLVTRGSCLGGVLELKISGSRDLVDNIKALIESVLQAEAAHVSEAVPSCGRVSSGGTASETGAASA